MKAFRVNSKGNPACLHKCVSCRRAIRVGDVVLAMTNNEAAWGAKTQYAHKRCVTRLLDCAGADDNEKAFEDLRGRIALTGEAFPRSA